MFAKEDVEFVERRFAQLSSLRIGQVVGNCVVDRGRLLFALRRSTRLRNFFNGASKINRPLPTAGFQAAGDVLTAGCTLDPHRARAPFVERAATFEQRFR
jgi:hypothetical protein